MVLTYQDGSKYPFEAGDTLIIPDGVIHRDVFDPDEELVAFFVHFKWEHSKDFFSKIDNSSFAELSLDTAMEIERILELLRHDTGLTDLDNSLACNRVMNILLLIYREMAYPSRHKSKNLVNRKTKLILEAKKYINQCFNKNINLNDIAEHLQVSPFFFHEFSVMKMILL